MPITLAASASDEAIIDFIDQWVSLLEEEKYEEACLYLGTESSWSGELLRAVIKGYGDEADNKVTRFNNGTALDGAGKVEVAKQRKEISWADESRGDVWYDLNVNGLGSDLTATFDLKRQDEQMQVILQDIHVM